MRCRTCLLAVAIACAAALASLSVAADGGSDVPTPTPTYDYGQFLEDEAVTMGTEPSTVSVLLDMAWKLGLVLALAYGVLWLAKRFVSVRAVTGGQQMKVIETVTLGGNRSLHLLRVGSRTLLVGATSQQLSTLADVSEAAELPMALTWAEGEDLAGPPVDESRLPTIKPSLQPAYDAVRNIRRLWNGRQPADG